MICRKWISKWARKQGLPNNPMCPWMNVNYYRSESGVSINSALVSKTQMLRIFLHKGTAGQASFCSSSISHLWASSEVCAQNLTGKSSQLLPAPSPGPVKISDGRHQTREEGWSPCAHSRLASIPTFLLPFLWIQEVPLRCSPDFAFGEDLGRKGVCLLGSGWGDGARGGGSRGKQKELSFQQLTLSLHLPGSLQTGSS